MINTETFTDYDENCSGLELVKLVTEHKYTVIELSNNGSETIIGFSDAPNHQQAALEAFAHVLRTKGMGYNGIFKVVNNRTGKPHHIKT